VKRKSRAADWAKDKHYRRICKGGNPHDDAEVFVAWLFDKPGQKTGESTETIIKALQWYKREGGPDRDRYRRAVNHAKDFIDRATGKPCVGWTINYRGSGKGSNIIALTDPQAVSVDDWTIKTIATMHGFVQQEKQQATINRRMAFHFEDFADFLLNKEPPDRVGYRVLTRMTTELEHDGFITEESANAFLAWVATVQ